MLLVVEPSALVSNLGGRLHVRPIFSHPTIILHFPRIFVPVRILDKPPHEFIVLEGALELSAAVQLEAALSLSLVLGPRAVVNASFEGVNASAVLLIVDPLAVVVFIFIVGVPSFSVLHSVLPTSLVNGLFSVQIDEDSVSVLLALKKLALVAEVLPFEGVKTLAVIDA